MGGSPGDRLLYQLDIPSIPNKQINVPKLKKLTLEERIKICQEKVGNMVHYCNTVCETIDIPIVNESWVLRF